eukprot:GHVS01021788.1.p1 GENE.GHVS01021788.1~~GHVS01021788.1.p1  ORF type:complete len:417 (-),score=70.84 GHVS01021788.1:1009-2259(-)
MTKNAMIATAGLSLGPAILILLFVATGNRWTLQELHMPLLMGCCIAPFGCVLLWWFRNVTAQEEDFEEDSGSLMPDEATFQMRLDEAYEQNCSNNSPLVSLTAAPAVLLGAASPALRRMSLIGSEAPAEQLALAEGLHRRKASDGGSTSEAVVDVVDGSVDGGPGWRVRAVPCIVAGSDFVRKVGAGMTVKFFALFFMKDYRFQPVHVSILFCIYPLCIVLFMRIVQSLSKPLGRAQAVTLWQIMGILLLLVMVYVEDIRILLLAFLLRGSFSNAVYPIDRSIIMDYVSSKNRGKWNAVESLTSMTWSGSAVVGGLLADTHDYRYTFLITAGIYTVSLAMYLPLLWLVPRVEKDAVRVAMGRKLNHSRAADKSARSCEPTSSSSSSSLTTSLLSGNDHSTTTTTTEVTTTTVVVSV